MTEHICPWCGGEEFVLLGQLGRRTHVRCRACGADSSFVPEPETVADEVEDFLGSYNRHPASSR